ncbi:hypothetical protein ACS0TY_021143 [Phlomoides rotata]
MHAAVKPEKGSTEKTTSMRVRSFILAKSNSRFFSRNFYLMLTNREGPICSTREDLFLFYSVLFCSPKFRIIAMARICRRKTEVLLVVEEIILEIVFMLSVIINRFRNTSQFWGLNVENVHRYRMADRIPQQIEHMSELVGMSDTDCFDNLRLNREAFNRLCYLLRHMGGLVDGRYVTVGEQVALFLCVLSHHSKVRVVRFRFKRSAVLKLHEVLLAKPSPVTDDSTHPSWKHFKVISTCVTTGILMEKVLSEVMKKIVLEGWKTENGFKIGYLNLLSTYMKQVFPNTDLKPEPHINSRIMVWKRNYHSLATGEALVSHLRATTPPPLFSTGMNVDSASNRVGDKTQDESQSPSGYAQIGESTDTGKTNSRRKRKSPLQPDPMVCVVQNFCDNASNRLGDIAQIIGHDQDLPAARKMIYSSISKMSMLTLHEKLRATTLIARNAEDIDVFFSLPDPDRVEWVNMLLNDEI